MLRTVSRTEECPKLRFRRKGCTYKYECKEECTERKDCKTTYQYKCKEYRKQVRSFTANKFRSDTDLTESKIVWI